MAAKAVSPGTVSAVEKLTSVNNAIAERTLHAVATAPQHARATWSAIPLYVEGLGAAGALRLGLYTLVAFLAGFLIDLLYWRFLLSRPSARAATAVPDFPASIPYLARRLFREAGGALLAVIAAIAVLALTLPPREALIGMMVVLWVWFVPRLAQITLKFFLSPTRADLRLVATDEPEILRYSITPVRPMSADAGQSAGMGECPNKGTASPGNACSRRRTPSSAETSAAHGCWTRPRRLPRELDRGRPRSRWLGNWRSPCTPCGGQTRPSGKS